MTTLTSRNGPLHIGPGHPLVLISDALRVNGRAKLQLRPTVDGEHEGLARARGGPDVVARMVALAQSGAAAGRNREAGMDMVDIMVNDADEVILLPAIAVAVHDAVGCPISLDSRNPEALRAALSALQPHKVLINSVTAEVRVLEVLLPIAAEFGAAIIAMPIGDVHGLPKDVPGRVAEATVILERAAAHGISREDVVMDAICLASSVEPGSMAVALETLRRFRDDLGVATTLGISNAGHGMPTRSHIALAYLLAAVPWGLDCALVNPRTPFLIEEVRAIDFLTDRDPYGKRYLRHYRATHPPSPSRRPQCP
ncbi:MAG: dihydropteroate synthase [Anaerolineae bacterium]|jgi:5-methyltetrahydrofolate--homocysteine methyltransferase|nr:dihydropteroate synthase [Anaerolineae bacterium]